MREMSDDQNIRMLVKALEQAVRVAGAMDQNTIATKENALINVIYGAVMESLKDAKEAQEIIDARLRRS